MPLPPDFAWHEPGSGTYPPEWRHLKVGGPNGMEVALLNPRQDGRWLVTINRHQDWKAFRHGVTDTREEAMRAAERWVIPREARLRFAFEEWRKPKGKWVAFKRAEDSGPRDI